MQCTSLSVSITEVDGTTFAFPGLLARNGPISHNHVSIKNDEPPFYILLRERLTPWIHDFLYNIINHNQALNVYLHLPRQTVSFSPSKKRFLVGIGSCCCSLPPAANPSASVTRARSCERFETNLWPFVFNPLFMGPPIPSLSNA